MQKRGGDQSGKEGKEEKESLQVKQKASKEEKAEGRGAVCLPLSFRVERVEFGDLVALR